MFKTKLLQALDSNVNANKARLKSLVLLVSAVLQHRTVNLAILATTNDGKSTSNESRYRRFQDFFLRFSLCLPSVAQAILARVPKPPGGYVLAMDRTNWQFGRRDINFLTIAVVTGKVAIPVVWMALPPKTRQGNSNAAQRIALTEKLLALITSKDIWALVMDREFVGKQWLQWLDKHGVAYVVRLKKNVIVGKQTAEKLATRRGRKSARKQNIFGLELFFSCKTMKSRDRDTHLMVASNRFVGKEALQLYRQRWGIERLFGHLKKKGFDLEATHMTDAAKLEKLFTVVTLAFVFSYAWGCRIKAAAKPLNAHQKRKSLFRLSLEDILRLLDSPSNDRRLREFFHWLRHGKSDPIFLV